MLPGGWSREGDSGIETGEDESEWWEDDWDSGVEV